MMRVLARWSTDTDTSPMVTQLGSDAPTLGFSDSYFLSP